MNLQGHEYRDGNAGEGATTPEVPETTGSARVAFHVLPGAATFESVSQRLEEGGAFSESGLDAVAARLAQDPGFRAVIVFPNPVLELGDRLLDGKSIEEAMNAWQERTAHLLTLFRRDRRRLALLDGDAAIASPERLAAAIGERFPLNLGPEAGQDSEVGVRVAEPLHLVAAQALRQDENAAMLHAELEASALPLGPAYQIDVDALVAGETRDTTSPEELELRVENERLRSQLRQVQDDLKAQVFGEDELKRLRSIRDSLKMELEESREEYLQERKELTDKLSRVSNDLVAMRQSHSWRLTSPLRRLLGLFVGGSNL